MQCTYSSDIHLRSLPTKPVGIRLIDARTGETSDNQEDLTIVLRACQMPYNMGHTHTLCTYSPARALLHQVALSSRLNGTNNG